MIRFQSAIDSPAAEQQGTNFPAILWDSVVTTANLTSTTEDADFPLVNLANPSTGVKWKGSSDSPLGQEVLTVTTTGLGSIDGIGIAGHNFASAGIAVSVEVDAGGSPVGWVEVIPPAVPAEDGVLMFRFEPATYDGVRVVLAAGTAAPQAAVLYAGAWFVFERGVQPGFTPLPFGVVNDSVNGRSESGQFLGRIITGSEQRSTASFIGLSQAWTRETLMPVVLELMEEPFFFAWNGRDFPAETGYAWLTDDPAPVFDEHRLAAITFNMAGVSS